MTTKPQTKIPLRSTISSWLQEVGLQRTVEPGHAQHFVRSAANGWQLHAVIPSDHTVLPSVDVHTLGPDGQVPSVFDSRAVNLQLKSPSKSVLLSLIAALTAILEDGE